MLRRFDARSIFEREAAALKNKTEEELASSFSQFTPENMLRLVRLANPFSGGIDFKNDPEDVIKQYVFGEDGTQKAELTEEAIETIIDRFPTFFDKKDVEESEKNVQKGPGVPIRNRIFSEFSMEVQKDSITYIKPKYSKKEAKKLLENWSPTKLSE